MTTIAAVDKTRVWGAAAPRNAYHSGMAVDAEEVQELGRDGVAMVKRWLEATTFMELQWNVYEDTAKCVVPCLGGLKKKFDLAGAFIGINRNPVVVESKRYKSSGGQHKYFKEFLAIAYSNILREEEILGSDLKREFVWVTTTPFQITEWNELATERKIVQSLDANPGYLGGIPIDLKVVRKASERVWVLVMNQKQEDISLNHDELMTVLTTLKRKAPTL